jgi:CubicO group peptidase (beta-lactamase class C family)
MNNDIVASLDALFDRWNRADQPGLVVGVQHRGRPLYRRGFGMASLETGQANSLATRMRIGSTSKHFLALLVVQLEREGLLDLDAPIGLYIPELEAPNAEPTLRQLLQHRGGTRCHIDLGFIGHGMLVAPEKSGLDILRRQQGRNFAPGMAMLYNNGGYHLISLAASRVAKASLASLLKSYLFDPLEMHDTDLVLSDHVVTPGIATLHVPDGGRWRRGLFPSHELLGEGGIVSTLDDMLKWAAYLQSSDAFGSQKCWDTLLDFPTEPDGSPGYYGLGLMQRSYRGVRTVRHAGGVVGGSCELVCVPDHALDIIIMSNGAPDAAPSLLADHVVDIVLADLLDAPSPDPDPGDYSGWIGDYGSDETGMVYSVGDHAGKLCLRIAQYEVPYALALDPDGRLSTGLTGIGTLRIECRGDDARELLVDFAGHTSAHAKLRAEADSRLPMELAGAFESPESGLEASIEVYEDGLILHVRDRWGSSVFNLSALGGHWFAMRSRLAGDRFGAVLWFPEGWQGGFTLHSARTRNLQFLRIPERKGPQRQ